ERMVGSGLLWLALVSCILTQASAVQRGKYSAHLASQMSRKT
ncbi:GP2 isoform 9, partial [Pan troglodytes]